jgi:hypothetical protein
VREISELTDSGRPAPGAAVPAIPDAAARILARWDRVREPAAPQVLTDEQAGAREIAHLEATARLFRAWDQ